MIMLLNAYTHTLYQEKYDMWLMWGYRLPCKAKAGQFYPAFIEMTIE